MLKGPMNADQFSVYLGAVVVPCVLNLIVEYSFVGEARAASAFYRSKLYEELSDEETKLWRYSPQLLFRLFMDELLTGSFDYPEEGCVV